MMIILIPAREQGLRACPGLALLIDKLKKYDIFGIDTVVVVDIFLNFLNKNLQIIRIFAAAKSHINHSMLQYWCRKVHTYFIERFPLKH